MTKKVADVVGTDETPQQKAQIRERLVEFYSISLRYGARPTPVIENLSFEVNQSDRGGRFVVFLGPSGCGKSTLLKLLAGLLAPTSGEIKVLGQKVSAPSGKRGMVFQNYTSFDWLTVLENVRFPLVCRGFDPKESTDMASEYLMMVGLAESAEMFPRHLSGGMRQRVAIARSLINNPDLLLMDEPFGALDHFTREDMQENLLKIWRAKKNNIFFVTHDIEEAVFLADEIYVMSSQPMEVHSKIPVDFPYESRTPELKFGPPFVQLVKEIQEEIREIVSKDLDKGPKKKK